MSGNTTDGGSEDDELEGISGSNRLVASRLFLAAPSTGREKNTIRLALQAIACWKLNDVRFSFGSSFVLPGTRREFRDLSALLKKHPGAPLTVFGHADSVNTDVFNKRLSGHRAESIYAVLIRDTDRWEKLFHDGADGEGWGLSSIQQMLTALGNDPGPPNGVMTAQTKKALELFQAGSGLRVAGDAGRETRQKIFAAYMDFLLADRLQKTDFLGEGVDKGGKADFQGCSEFNPLQVISVAERNELSKTSNKTRRDAENSINRRVLVLFFPPGSQVGIAKWPCPRVDEGPGACRRRFWSDGEVRRTERGERRLFEDTEDTYACRFYHRLVESSPCEGSRRRQKTSIRIVVVESRSGAPIPDIQLVVRSATMADLAAVTDETGSVFIDGLDPGTVDVVSIPLSIDQSQSTVNFVALGRPAATAPVTQGIRSTNGSAGTPTGLTGAPQRRASKPRFIVVEAPAGRSNAIVSTNRPPPAPFVVQGLATNEVHHIQVSLPFEFFLKDENGMGIPEADFRIVMADGQETVGRLDRDGRGSVADAPRGPFSLQYPDIDDIKAKSLAARIRKASAEKDLDEIRSVLLYGQDGLNFAAQAYAAFFNDLSGNGMAEDIQDAIGGNEDETMLLILMIRGGLQTRKAGFHRVFEDIED